MCIHWRRRWLRRRRDASDISGSPIFVRRRSRHVYTRLTKSGKNVEKLGLFKNSALASRVFAQGPLKDAREKDEIAARRGRACARRVDTRPVHDAAREAMLERRERRLADDEPHALRGEHSRTVVMTKFTL